MAQGLTIKIGLLGGPCCGKSSLAAAVFAKLKSNDITADYVPEFAREAINKKIVDPTTLSGQFVIYDEQKFREDCIPEEIQYVISDSPLVFCFPYALEYSSVYNKSDRHLLHNIYLKFLDSFSRYDYLFLCCREKKYILDGTRTQTEEQAIEIDNKIKFLLDIHHVKYSELFGTIEERVKQVLDIIGVKL